MKLLIFGKAAGLHLSHKYLSEQPQYRTASCNLLAFLLILIASNMFWGRDIEMDSDFIPFLSGCPKQIIDFTVVRLQIHAQIIGLFQKVR